MAPQKPMGAYIPLKQAASALGMEYPTAASAAIQKRLPGAVKIGGRWYVPKQVLDALVSGAPLPDGVLAGDAA